MNLEQWANLSNLMVLVSTVLFGLAWVAHLLEWSSTRRVADAEPGAERVLAGVGTAAEKAGGQRQQREGRRTDGRDPVTRESGTDRARSGPDCADRLGEAGVILTGLAGICVLGGVVARGIAAERVPWGNMYEFAITGLAVVM